ncbi:MULTISPECIES: TetR/AcrR family transcriptional regulator [unclassified Streptomyces]|uniref:TetR/AcrR family transcriptional regulator n=1 Tax=unclassified Streptomyces TaxID=2593676 RepID=UPI002DDBB341|nr:TetR/AcrR family transcriptional regulator [Streptomyces sp. NBC_01775]WSB80323.1 TetR/AcrR family transcriptional regulator [Streptomyces sp. NBC_01775]WSS40180.1 TetR/AcrR family transcriptional regulator [Streptomyces sp. NBC_01187]
MAGSRESLLAAAAEEFARYGARGTRIQAIVQRAGVNERMIYHHFGSKKGLYKAVLVDQMQEWRDSWHPAVEKAVTLEPYEGMRTALAAFAETLHSKPVLVGLWLHEALDGWQTLPAPPLDALPSGLRELYERGQAEGVFRADCPFEVAHGMAMSALVGALVMSGRGFQARQEANIGFDSGAARDRALGQLLDGMTGPK